MNQGQSQPRMLEITLRWTARVLSLGVLGLILMFCIGERANPVKIMAGQPFATISFLTSCVGLILAWRWQGLGGLLVVGGMATFYAQEFAIWGRFPKGPAFAVIAAPGVIFLAAWWLKRSRLRTSNV